MTTTGKQRRPAGLLSPQAFNEHVVGRAPLAVHTDRDAVADQPRRERVAGELRALIGVEDLGPAAGQRLVERFEAERRFQRVRQSPGEYVPATEVDRYAFDKSDRIFLNLEKNKVQTLGEVWSYVLATHNAEAFGDVAMNWEWVPKVIETRDDIKSKFIVVRAGRRGRLYKLKFTATVRQRWSPLPLVEALTYTGADTSDTVVARWKGTGSNGVAEMVVLLRKRPD